MGRVLIVDDTPFWRDVTADALRIHGYTVTTAGDGVAALGLLQRELTDIIILDVEMPRLQGLSFLEQIRRDERLKRVPVIMLTGDMQKDHILQAKKLGATDYLLKARFSPKELLERIEKRIGSMEQPAAPTAVPIAGPVADPTDAHVTADISQLLSRDQCLARVESALAGRTLSGVVSQVIASASSPRTDLADLAILIGRDPVLSARVLQAANSPSYLTARGTISTIPEAVRLVGCSIIRNIAATVGVFDAMPPAEPDGFNPIRSWQHSLGVATLCNDLARAESASLAYLVGLCHDLGEILFRTHFGEEYRQVLATQQSSGKPMHEVEMRMLGITQGELSEKILQQLGLPDPIRRPIEQFHEAALSNATPQDTMARVLQLAENYANGILLAASEQSCVRPFAQAHCRAATGTETPARPDELRLRGEILAMTALHSRMSPKEQKKLLEPLFARSEARIFVARDPSFSAFDPLTAALESLAQVTIGPAIPSPVQLLEYQGLVVVARTPAVPGFTSGEIQESIPSVNSRPLPLLWLTGTAEPAAQDQPRPARWPISLSQLAQFVQSVASKAVTP